MPLRTLSAALFLFALCCPAFAADPQTITIGTGDRAGVYFPAGKAVAALMNEQKSLSGVHFLVEETGGSVFNVNAVLEGKLDLGIAQSDRQYQATFGLSNWRKQGPQLDLRAVFSLHSEAVTLLARTKSRIRTFKHLKGKTINLGSSNSGHRSNALHAVRMAGLDWRNDFQAESLDIPQAFRRLEDGTLDAVFYTVGHPNDRIRKLLRERRAFRFVAIPRLERLLAKYRYYSPTQIPIEAYPGAKNRKDVKTLGVKATVVASKAVPNEIVFALTRTVFENLETLRKKHPAFAGLTPKGMLSGNTAPFHEGARRYFEEAGLLEAKKTPPANETRP